MKREANDRPTYMASEMRCLEKVHGKGFTREFKVVGELLLCVDDGQQYKQDEISIINFYRFEGISDPDDMSIIYVIQTPDGNLGTLTDAYGIYADDEISSFVLGVEKIQKQQRGWSQDL